MSGPPTPPPPPPPPPPPTGPRALPPAPQGWAPPDDAAESLAQLAHFWAEERFEWNEDRNLIEQVQELDHELLAKADVDECFNGVGQASGVPVDGRCATGTPKRNQSYVWGLTRTGRDLWFGTAANVVCQVVLGVLAPDPKASLQNQYFVCEGQNNAAGMGDFRPPHLYRYNLDSGTLTLLDAADGTEADQLRKATFGFRSAGAADGVVFLAGPGLQGGINMFAFDDATGELLGAKSLPQFSDIRTWVNVRGVLYAGVGNTLDALGTDATASACLASAAPCDPQPAGSILRWRGKKCEPQTLFDFEVVGVIDNEAANLAFHEGHLFVTTWPTFGGDISKVRPAGLFMSPWLGAAGLSVSDVGCWREIWSVAEYDPDPIARLSTGGGAIASFGGKLYWGTMSVPFLATTIAAQLQQAGKLDLDANQDGKIDADEQLALALGSHRSVAVFALVGDPDASPFTPGSDWPTRWIELVFGERYLPRYDAERRMYTVVADEAHQNVAGLMPECGSSGFGNFFNAYVWSMTVYRDALYIGTFDWVQVARGTLEGLLGIDPNVPPPPDWGTDGEVQCISYDGEACEESLKGSYQLTLEQLGERLPRDGADLVRIGCDGNVAAETLTGLGNDTNYGIRNMVTDGAALYVGTANAMNIHPSGGWELLQLTPRHTCAEPRPPQIELEQVQATLDELLSSPEVLAWAHTMIGELASRAASPPPQAAPPTSP
ncbi:hypothetical protein [Anaeromyxobacter diazotrophicus]|uniref:Lipoprotein n=1 Tax=Anaeromyxobacter diazotrophicus TaxID=2590199 RepID=A0A7I9VT55_9BACT|nr:hypothetical protein [Anaeromyxobacter diazotrophicus]GEJ59279.1 lipoprotein [Anaeromyxobacter diazotrophicus]